MRPALAAVALLLSQCSPAFAAMPCVPREDMTRNLTDGHGERPVSMGLDNSGVMVEVFAAPNGNWTIILTTPDGLSCLMAAGQGWETLPAAPAGSDL